MILSLVLWSKTGTDSVLVLVDQFEKWKWLVLLYITPIKRIRKQRVSTHMLIYSSLFFKLFLGYWLDFECGLGLTLGVDFGLGLSRSTGLGLE